MIFKVNDEMLEGGKQAEEGISGASGVRYRGVSSGVPDLRPALGMCA